MTSIGVDRKQNCNTDFYDTSAVLVLTRGDFGKL